MRIKTQASSLCSLLIASDLSPVLTSRQTLLTLCALFNRNCIHKVGIVDRITLVRGQMEASAEVEDCMQLESGTLTSNSPSKEGREVGA